MFFLNPLFLSSFAVNGSRDFHFFGSTKFRRTTILTPRGPKEPSSGITFCLFDTVIIINKYSLRR
jgi:hypothetical protein